MPEQSLGTDTPEHGLQEQLLNTPEAVIMVNIRIIFFMTYPCYDLYLTIL
ncbi:hypothetical protein [Legionella sp.]